MQSTPIRSLIGDVTDFLASNPTPQEILAYRLPDDLQQRAHDLLERNREGHLSDAEQQEMLDFVRMDQMLSLLKAKTRLKLKQDSA